jgi:IclR family transcriptional regulator, acetate operon repressor
MSSLERGLEILAEIGESGSSTVEQMSRRVGMPISTTYRYVSALRALGFLGEHEGRIVAGPQLLRLVRSTDVDEALARLADPLLLELVYRTGETAILTVQVGSMALCVNSVEPVRSVRLSHARGSTQPLYAGASGKPLLAYADPAFVESLVENGLVTFTPRTPDAQTLRRQLAHIRSTGVCVTIGELDAKTVGVGVPVFWGGDVAAVLSVAGPVSRIDRSTVERLVSLVAAAGEALTQILDGSGDTLQAVSMMEELADAQDRHGEARALSRRRARGHQERRGA